LLAMRALHPLHHLRLIHGYRQQAGSYRLGFAVFASVFDAYDRKVKISVDGKFCGSIIRPTSGAVETEKPLRFNELQRFLRSRQEGRFSSSEPRSS